MSYAACVDMAWDLRMARFEIARRGGDDPRAYAEQRYAELKAAPWRSNMQDWRGRVEAFKLIAKGQVDAKL